MNLLKTSIPILISALFVFLFLFTASAAGQDISEQESKQQDTVFVMHKSPWGAVGRSAILPGWGQFYNESYWKIPVIWGIGAWFVYNWVQNNNKYKTNKNLFLETGDNLYKIRRDFYRDQRDNFTIYFVLLYLLNLVDAYVDAHLFDFTVEEDYRLPVTNLRFKFYF